MQIPPIRHCHAFTNIQVHYAFHPYLATCRIYLFSYGQTILPGRFHAYPNFYDQIDNGIRHTMSCYCYFMLPKTCAHHPHMPTRVLKQSQISETKSDGTKTAHIGAIVVAIRNQFYLSFKISKLKFLLKFARGKN